VASGNLDHAPARDFQGPRAGREPVSVASLLIIFLTIFVNLVGFGIIIPLLPFYAETFGASPVVIGLLFAAYSVCQLIAAPALGDLSDRYGRRPVLIFSLAARCQLRHAGDGAVDHDAVSRAVVDGLSGGNISTARAYVADVTEPKDRARAYGMIGRRSARFHHGAGAERHPRAHQLHGTCVGAAAITLVATDHGVALAAETVHRRRPVPACRSAIWRR